jgi:hypothetical protein
MINHSASQTLLENQSSWQDKIRLARQPGAMPKLLRIKQRFCDSDVLALKRKIF